AIGWSLGVETDTLIAKPASDILDIIANPDGTGAQKSLCGLTSGFYEVALLRQNRDPQLMPARIDAINGPAGKGYTVVWLDPDGKLFRQKNNDFGQSAQEFALQVVDTQK